MPLITMIDLINNSYKLEQELDDMEARAHTISAMENLPAFIETIRFIFDRCNGRFSEISEKTVEGAFDYVINEKKASIYSNRTLSHGEKKRLIFQIESSYQMLKEYFKSSDFVTKQTSRNNKNKNIF